MDIVLFTIGFTNKSAEKFFTLLEKNKVSLLVDTRRNNKSQLAGFAKGIDLKFFTKKLVNIEYIHDLRFAPSDILLKKIRNKDISWEQYEIEYINELITRNFINELDISFYNNACFLCSEDKPDKCHRRLLTEYFQKLYAGIIIKHLV